MSDARKMLLFKAYVAGGGTFSVSDTGSSVRDAPATLAQKLKVKGGGGAASLFARTL